MFYWNKSNASPFIIGERTVSRNAKTFIHSFNKYLLSITICQTQFELLRKQHSHSICLLNNLSFVWFLQSVLPDKWTMKNNLMVQQTVTKLILHWGSKVICFGVQMASAVTRKNKEIVNFDFYVLIINTFNRLWVATSMFIWNYYLIHWDCHLECSKRKYSI